MPIVTVPGHGDVEFPDSMSDDRIAEAIRKNGLAGSPGVTDKVAAFGNEAMAGFYKGLGSFSDTVRTAVDLPIEAITGEKGRYTGKNVFSAAGDVYAERAKAGDLSGPTKLIAETLGGAVPGLAEFGPGYVSGAAMGAVRGYSDEGTWQGAAKGAVGNLGMRAAFHVIGKIFPGSNVSDIASRIATVSGLAGIEALVRGYSGFSKSQDSAARGEISPEEMQRRADDFRTDIARAAGGMALLETGFSGVRAQKEAGMNADLSKSADQARAFTESVQKSVQPVPGWDSTKIIDALSSGQPVPEESLAAYPELKKISDAISGPTTPAQAPNEILDSGKNAGNVPTNVPEPAPVEAAKPPAVEPPLTPGVGEVPVKPAEPAAPYEYTHVSNPDETFRSARALSDEILRLRSKEVRDQLKEFVDSASDPSIGKTAQDLYERKISDLQRELDGRLEAGDTSHLFPPAGQDGIDVSKSTAQEVIDYAEKHGIAIHKSTMKQIASGDLSEPALQRLRDRVLREAKVRTPDDILYKKGQSVKVGDVEVTLFNDVPFDTRTSDILRPGDKGHESGSPYGVSVRVKMPGKRAFKATLDEGDVRGIFHGPNPAEALRVALEIPNPDTPVAASSVSGADPSLAGLHPDEIRAQQTAADAPNIDFGQTGVNLRGSRPENLVDLGKGEAGKKLSEEKRQALMDRLSYLRSEDFHQDRILKTIENHRGETKVEFKKMQKSGASDAELKRFVDAREEDLRSKMDVEARKIAQKQAQAEDQAAKLEADAAEQGFTPSTPEEKAYYDDLDSTFGSGVAVAFMRAVNAGKIAYERDLKPMGKSLAQWSVDAVRQSVDFLWPKARAGRDVLDYTFESLGRRDKEAYRLQRRVSEWEKAFDKIPQAKMVEFVDRMKTDAWMPAEWQPVRDFIRLAEDATYREVESRRPGTTYKENHLRVLWDVVPGNVDKIGFMGGKRPLRGDLGWAKRSTLETMSEGIKRGGIPVTYNPIKMFRLAQADAMKFVTAHDLWVNAKAYREWLPSGNRMPDGYTSVQDSIRRYIPDGEAAQKGGQWVIREDLGRILNNHLGHDYLREATLGRGLLAVKNTVTAVELSFSAFHAIFETMEAASSSMGLGLQKVVSGDVGGGLQDIKRGVIGLADPLGAPLKWAEEGILGTHRVRDFMTRNSAATEAATLGKLGQEYITDPAAFKARPEVKWFLDRYPNIDQIMDNLFTGGGKLTMHEDYRLNWVEGFNRALNSGNPIGAFFRAAPAVQQMMMQPLFETYIPRLKIGMFLREHSFDLKNHAADLAAGTTTEAKLARDRWSFVEQRLGEMNFDAIFWKRTFKSINQLLFRSVTWKLGNLQAMGGIPFEIGENVYKHYKTGENMDWKKTAWGAGMLVQSYVTAAVVMGIAVGRLPGEDKDGKFSLGRMVKDMAFPVVSATGERLSNWGYLRDVFHMLHNFPKYVQTSMSGMWNRGYEAYQNKDYAGVQVYNPDHNVAKKAYDVAAHVIPEPFSYSTAKRSRESGEPVSKQATGFAGLNKAPYWINQSSAERMASEINHEKARQGAVTEEQYTMTKTGRDLSNKLRAAQSTPERSAVLDEIRKKVQAGEMTTKQALAAIQHSKMAPFQSQFEHLSLQDALKVYEAASPEEKQQVKAMLRKKASGLFNIPANMRGDLPDRIKRAFRS